MADIPDRITKAPYPIAHGEHFYISGKTQSGKSAFARAVFAGRKHLVYFRTKGDKVPWSVDKRTTTTATSLKALSDPRVNRLEVFPDKNDAGLQQECFYEVMQKIRKQGGRTLVVDEGYEMKRLKLMDELETFATQGASEGITLGCCSQRPAWISRFLISEPSHHVSFYCDGRDAKTLRECISESHYAAVRKLETYQFCWTHGQPPKTWVGNLQDLA
jgi:hypothetical protein